MSYFLQLYVMCMHPVEKEKTEATNIYGYNDPYQ